MEKILQLQSAQLEQQTKHLRDIEKHAATDKLIQLSQSAVAYKTLKDEDKIANEIADLAEKTEKGLLSRNGGGLNSNIIVLTDIIRKSVRGQADSINELIKSQKNNNNIISAIPQANPEQRAGLSPLMREMSVRAGEQYVASFKDEIKDRLKSLTKIGSWIDLSGGKSKTLIGQAVRRKVAENQYVQEQKKIEPQTPTKQLRANFRKSQSVARAQRENEATIDKYIAKGYGEKDLEKTGLIAERERLHAEQIKYNPGYRAMHERAEESAAPTPVASAVPSTAPAPVASAVPSTAPVAPTLAAVPLAPTLAAAPLTLPTPAIKETEEENLRLMQDQTETIKKIEENTRPLGDIVNFLQNKKPEEQQDGKTLSIFETLKSLASDAVKVIGVTGAAIIAKFNKILGPIGAIFGKFSKILGPVGAVGAGAFEAYEGWNKAEEDLAAGRITKKEATLVKGEAVGKGVGGAAGAIALGAKGAAIGSAIGPIGTVVGGLAGGALGYFGGKEVGGVVGSAGVSAYPSVKEFLGFGDKNNVVPVKPASVTSEALGTNNRFIANEPPVPDVNLPNQQMDGVEALNKMENAYGSEIEQQYAIQRAERILTPTPTAADKVTITSSSNAIAREKQATTSAPVVINAPQTSSVQQTQNYAPPSPPRNTESSIQQYNRMRFAF